MIVCMCAARRMDSHGSLIDSGHTRLSRVLFRENPMGGAGSFRSGVPRASSDRGTGRRMATPISPSVATADKDPERSRRGRLIGLAACSALLLVCGALVFRYLFQYGVSNIGRIDGSSQNFPAFVYVHDWFTAVLSGHGGDFGMWSWRLGLGSDTLGSLSYYVADPFALIALLFPAHLLEYVYEALLFLRILCAGLAGSLYLRNIRATR